MLLDKEEVLRVLERMNLKFYQFADIKNALDSIQEVRAIPTSFITTLILKQQKLVDFERYEDDKYDTLNYHKLLAFKELLDKWRSYEKTGRY